MRPHGIDYLGPLPHQKIARAMQHQPALLLGRFDLYKTHGRPPHRLANRLGVGRIVLLAPEAILGARINVPTPTGSVTMTVPKGSNTGTVLRLRGKVVPRRNGGHGDELVKL